MRETDGATWTIRNPDFKVDKWERRKRIQAGINSEK